MKRKPSSVLAYEKKVAELHGQIEVAARDLGKLNEAAENARVHRQVLAKDEETLKLAIADRNREIASLDASIVQRKEILLRNVRQAEGSVAILLVKADSEEKHLKTLQEAQKKYDSIHLAGQDAKHVHEAILWEIEASKQTLHAIRG